MANRRRRFHLKNENEFQEQQILPTTAAFRTLSLQQKQQEQQNRVVNKLLALIRSKNEQNSISQTNLGKFSNRQQQQQQQIQSVEPKQSTIFTTSTSPTTTTACAITTTSAPTTSTITRLLLSTSQLHQLAIENAQPFDQRRGRYQLIENGTLETYFGRRGQGNEKIEIRNKNRGRFPTTTTYTTIHKHISTTASNCLYLFEFFFNHGYFWTNFLP
jgi:hypothetical protein